MGKQILIADDSSSMRQMLAFTLTEEGYEVVLCVDGQDALAKFNANIKVVITDLNMPNINGIELIKRIRSGPINKFLPIIMVTTESEAAKKEEGKRAGASAWIVKPFTPENLIETIKKVAG